MQQAQNQIPRLLLFKLDLLHIDVLGIFSKYEQGDRAKPEVIPVEPLSELIVVHFIGAAASDGTLCLLQLEIAIMLLALFGRDDADLSDNTVI